MKRDIHTTLEVDTLKWIEQTCDKRKINVNSLLEEVIIFYRKNKDMPELLEMQRKVNISLLNDVIRDLIQGGMVITFNEKRRGEKWKTNSVPADVEKH